MHRFHPSIPAELIRNRALGGALSVAWLEALPSLIEECARHWDLRLDPPFPRLSFNYAAPARLPDGSIAVLKICPADDEFASEAAATAAFAGPHSVALLDADLPRGALLLERLQPGTPIGALAEDDEATAIAVDVMKQLWITPPPDGPYPTLEYWFRGFGDLAALFPRMGGPPASLLRHYEEIVARLLADTTQPALLHGDLNYGNVLLSARGWIAIDPKGVIGDPAFDAAILLHDKTDDIFASNDPAAFLARRLDIIVEHTGMDRAWVRDWGIAYAVLSAVWTAEASPTGWEDTMACAEVLLSL
jgi:streptomycin 6-kinase